MPEHKREFRETSRSAFLPSPCVGTGTLHLRQGQSGHSRCCASGDRELAQMTILKLDLSKITIKSMKDTEGI
ncbi:putative 2-Oxoglutarate Dehydrogenase E1 Component Dhktd1 [Manis pentadactyla]|nr:putative 2-Oxoglutarate Dehydrogenase E1 Component Dhktd1 [Manis pentadactyla]